MAPVFLLGPQRPVANLSACLERLGFDGPLVSITAGWQEWEGDIEWICEHVRRPVIDLALYARTESVFARDPKLFAAHRKRQDRLIALQRFYRARLSAALDAVQTLREMTGPTDLRDDALRSAVSSVRALDRHHLRQLRKVHKVFLDERSAYNHPELDREREAVWDQLQHAGAVIIGGGHVAVLAGRLRLFELEPYLRAQPLLAWSAAAMVACPRIVLFHDHLPQGARHPEVLDSGLGLVSRLVCFPNARARLRFDNRPRAALLAQRFAPERCAALDNGSILHYSGGDVAAATAVSCLERDGRLVPMSVT